MIVRLWQAHQLLFLQSHRRLGLKRSIVLKPDLIFPRANGKSLIRLAIWSHKLPHWSNDSLWFCKFLSRDLRTSWILLSNVPFMLWPPTGTIMLSTATSRWSLFCKSLKLSFMFSHVDTYWMPPSITRSFGHPTSNENLLKAWMNDWLL